jgi:IS4 transposase
MSPPGWGAANDRMPTPSPGASPRDTDAYSLSWGKSVNIDGRDVGFSLNYTNQRIADEHVRRLIADLSIETGKIPDDRAEWHRNWTPLDRWMRAHILRVAMGWRCKALATFFQDEPEYATAYGFVSDEEPTPPTQSRLYEFWSEEFTDEVRQACRDIARWITRLSQINGFTTRDGVFTADESSTSRRQLKAETTEQAWKKIAPTVKSAFHLKRAENAHYDESAFWEQHAYFASRQDMFANGGQDSFYVDSERREIPTASNHRHQIKKLRIDEMRSMLRDVARRLVKKAKANGELDRNIWVAVDITKGKEWTGEIDYDTENDVNQMDWIRGYKDGFYFQWATLQVVGLDVPIILDAIPINGQRSQAEIVGDLLDTGLDILPDIELAIMDRAFDGTEVKDTCEQAGVYYLNPKRKYASEKGRCSDLWRAGKRVDISETQSPVRSDLSRYKIYVPSAKWDEEVEDDEDDGVALQEELVREFKQTVMDKEVDTEDDEEEIGEWMLSDEFRSVLERMYEEQQEVMRGQDSESRRYHVFETNHPAISPDQESEEALEKHLIGFVANRYPRRWRIETGYSKLKDFLVRTTSRDHRYRFFNIVFAAVLYNAWRLLDILVQLEIADEIGYSTVVTADLFVTYAKRYFPGLDPPPPVES